MDVTTILSIADEINDHVNVVKVVVNKCTESITEAREKLRFGLEKNGEVKGRCDEQD